ncbi:MAG: hypothetical protein AVDCRST_MAG77-4850 [uncultured Chloroflexi bacterium]|uniref:Uncharacterized protein n=1 Tax=uncultured Chloroflexota bacterium TaxID=166587 RepID=A0A6J4K1A8_9CHLR|nr:MAG: hypothetical protein AVDCRST_MAG77-4850 [uncultured Chloroflexota bacterium]
MSRMVKALPRPGASGTFAGMGGNQFFLMGMLVGSACGLVLGSALGFELRPENLRTLRKLVRRLTGDDGHPHYESMV